MSFKRRGSGGHEQGIPMPNVLLNSPKKESDMAEPKVTRTHILPKSTARKSCNNIGKKLKAEQLLGSLDDEERQKLKETMLGSLGQKRRPMETKNIFSILNQSKDNSQKDVVEEDVVVIEEKETCVERSIGSKPVKANVFSSLSKSLKALNPSGGVGMKSGTQSPAESTPSGRRSRTQSPTGSTGTDQKSRTLSPARSIPLGRQSRTQSPGVSNASGQKSRTQSPSESILSGQRSRPQSPVGSVTSELALDESGHEPETGEASEKSSRRRIQQPRSRVGRQEFSNVDLDLILPGRSRSHRSSSGQREDSSLESNKPRSKIGAKYSNPENIFILSQRTGRSSRSSPALVSPVLQGSATSSSSVALRRLSNAPSTHGKDDVKKHQIKSGSNSKAVKTSSVGSGKSKIPLKEQAFAEASFDSGRCTLSSECYFDDSPVTRLRRFDFSPRSQGFYKAIAQGLKHVTPKPLTSVPLDAKNHNSDTEKSSVRSPRSSPRATRRYSYDELSIPFGRNEMDTGRRVSRSASKAAQSSDNSSLSHPRKGADTPPRYAFFDDSYSDSDSSVKVHPNVKSLLMHLEESKTKKKVPVICLENITNSPTSVDQSATLVNPDLEKEFAASIPTEAKRKLNFSSVVDLEKDAESVVTDTHTVPKRVKVTGEAKSVTDKLKKNEKSDEPDSQPDVDESAPEGTGEGNSEITSSGGSEPMQGVSSEGDTSRDGAEKDACGQAPSSPCTTELIKHGLLFGLIEKMQMRIPADGNQFLPEPEPEDEESSEQTSVREDVESSESSEEVSGDNSSDDSDEESEAMDTPTKNRGDSGSSDSDSKSEDDSESDTDTDSSDDEEEVEADGVVASTSAAYQEDRKVLATEAEMEAESMEVDDKVAMKTDEKMAVDDGFEKSEVGATVCDKDDQKEITDEPVLEKRIKLEEDGSDVAALEDESSEPKQGSSTFDSEGSPGPIPTLVSLAEAANGTKIGDKSIEEMPELTRETKELKEESDPESNNAAGNADTLDLLKILDDGESSSEFGRATPKLVGKLPISVEDKLHVVPASSASLLENDKKKTSEDEGMDLSATNAEVGTVTPKKEGSALLSYLTDHEYLNKTLADIQTESKENTPEKTEVDKKLTAEEKVFTDEERLAVSLPFKMFEKSDASTSKSNAFISSELESYLDTKSDLQSGILQCDKKLTNSEKIMKYTFGEDVHIDEDVVTPDLDNIDGILFMSFDSEDSLEAHTVVENNKKICSWHSSFYHRMKYVLHEQDRRMAKIGNSLVQSHITKKWKPMSERMAKYRRMLTNQVMKIKKRNLMKKMKEEEQKAMELAKKANDLDLLQSLTSGDMVEVDPDADAGSAYLHRTGKLHWRTQERLLKNLTPEEAKELQSELGLTLKKKRRKLVPFTHKKNTMEKHGSDHSMSPEERPAAVGSFDQLYQTFGANDEDKAEEHIEGVEALDDDEQVQLVQDAVTELLNQDKQSSKTQSRYKHPMMRSRSIFETFDMERPKIPSPTNPRQLLTQGSKSSFNMFKCDLQGLMKRRLDFQNKKLEGPMEGLKNLTKLTITGTNITDIKQVPDLPEEVSADDDCCIVLEDVGSALKLDDGKLRPQVVNQRMALFAASAIRLVKTVQRKGKMVYELEEPPKTSYLTQNRALARALQAAPRTAVKPHKGPCDQPGCRYGCVCHLLDPLDPSTNSSNATKNKGERCTKEYCLLGCICENIGTTSPKKCQKPQCRFVCHCEKPSTSKVESSHLWKEDTPCDKEYCQLGCVCSSVNSVGIGLSKCTKPECRFLCKCPRDEDGNPIDDEPKDDMPRTRQRRSRKESAWLKDMVSWDFLPSHLGNQHFSKINIPEDPPQHLYRGKKAAAVSRDPSFNPNFNNAQRLSIFPKSQQQNEEQQMFPFPKHLDAPQKYRCLLPSDAQKYPGHQVPSSSMNQPVFPQNEMSQPVFPRNEALFPSNDTNPATGLGDDNGASKLVSLHDELSKALPHLKILPPNEKKKKKKKKGVLPISMPEEATMYPWLTTDTYNQPDKSCARVRLYTPAPRNVRCTCCLSNQDGNIDECNKFKARLILEQALRRSAAAHKLDYVEKKLPPGLRRQSSDGSSYPPSPGAASLESFAYQDAHDHLGDHSRLGTMSPQLFSTQMMLLQPKKKDVGKRGQCRPQLLEISSNCQWLHIRPQLLSYVAQQVKDRAYPPVSKVAISTFLIEILPRAEHPTRIPPHHRDSLPAEMYSVRILIIPTPSSEKIGRPPVAATKEAVEISSDSAPDDQADDSKLIGEETCARITPFISNKLRRKTKKDKSTTEEIAKSNTEVVDLTKPQAEVVDLTTSPGTGDSESPGHKSDEVLKDNVSKIVDLTMDDDDCEDEGKVEKQQTSIVEKKQTTLDDDDDQMTVLAQKLKAISEVVKEMPTADLIDTVTIQSDDDEEAGQVPQREEDVSISKEVTAAADTDALAEMDLSDISQAGGENDHEMLPMDVEQFGLNRDAVVRDYFKKEISTPTDVLSDTDMLRESETKCLVVEKVDSQDKGQSFKDETDQAAILDSLACLKALSESIDPPEARKETKKASEAEDEKRAGSSGGPSAEKIEQTSKPNESKSSKDKTVESKLDKIRKLEKDTLHKSSDSSQPAKSSTRFQSFKSSVFKKKVTSAPYSDLAAIFQTAMPDKLQDKQALGGAGMRDTCSLSATDVDSFTAKEPSSGDPEPFKTISFSNLPESVKQPLAHQVYSLMLKTPGTNDILALVKIQPLANKKNPSLPMHEVTVKVVCPRSLILSLNRERQTCREEESASSDDGAQLNSPNNENVEELDLINSNDQKKDDQVSTEERLPLPNNHTPSATMSGKETCLQAEASSTVDDEQMSALSRRHENLRLSAEPILEKAVNMAKEFWQKLRGKSEDGEADQLGEKTSYEIGAGDAGTSKSETTRSGAGDAFRVVPDAIDLDVEPDSPDEDISKSRERNLFETFGTPEKKQRTSSEKEIKEGESSGQGGNRSNDIDVETQQTIGERPSALPPGLFGMIYEDITPVPSPNLGLVIAEPDSTVQSRPTTPLVDLKEEPDILPPDATVPMVTSKEAIVQEPSEKEAPRNEAEDSEINDVDDFASKAAAALADMASSVADELNLETRKNQDVEKQTTENAMPPDALSLVAVLNRDAGNLEEEAMEIPQEVVTSASSLSKEGAVDENGNPKAVVKEPSKDGDTDTDALTEEAIMNSTPTDESSEARSSAPVLKLVPKEEMPVDKENTTDKSQSIAEVSKLDESSGEKVQKMSEDKTKSDAKSADVVSKSDNIDLLKSSAFSVLKAPKSPALAPQTIMFRKSSHLDSPVSSPGSVTKTSAAIINRDLLSSGIKATFTAQVLPDSNTVISFDVKFGSTEQQRPASPSLARKQLDSNVPAAKSASELLSNSQPGTPLKGTGKTPGVNAASQNLTGPTSVASRVGPRILQTNTPASPRKPELVRILQSINPISPRKFDRASSGTSTPPAASIPEAPSVNSSERKGRRKEKHSIRCEMPEDGLTDKSIASKAAKQEVKKRKPAQQEYETLFYKNKKGVGDMPVTVVKTHDGDEMVDIDDLYDEPDIQEPEPSESDVDIEDYDSECELQVVRLLQAASDNLSQFYVNPDCALHCHEEMKRKAKALMISGRQEQQSPEPPPPPPPPPAKKKRIRDRRKQTLGKGQTPGDRKKPGPKKGWKLAKLLAENGETVSPAAELNSGSSPGQLGTLPLAGPRPLGHGFMMQGVPRPQMQIQLGLQRTPLPGMQSFQIKSTPSPGKQSFPRSSTPGSGAGGPSYTTPSPGVTNVVDDVALQVIQAMGVKPGQVVSIQRINPNQMQNANTPTSTPTRRSTPVSQPSTPARVLSPTLSTFSEPLESGAETPPSRYNRDEHCSNCASDCDFDSDSECVIRRDKTALKVSRERIRRKMMAAIRDGLKNTLGMDYNTPKVNVMRKAIDSIRALELRERHLVEEKKKYLDAIMGTARKYGELRFGEIPDVKKRKQFVNSLFPKPLHDPSSVPQFKQYCLIGRVDDSKSKPHPQKVSNLKMKALTPQTKAPTPKTQTVAVPVKPKPEAAPATAKPKVVQAVTGTPGPTVHTQAMPKPKQFVVGAKPKSRSRKKKITKVVPPKPEEDPKRLEERLPYIGCQGTLQRALQRQRVVPNLNPQKPTEEKSGNADKVVEAASEAGQSVTRDDGSDEKEVPLDVDNALDPLPNPASDDEEQFINITDSPRSRLLKRKGTFEPLDPNTTKRITFNLRPDEEEEPVVIENCVESNSEKINRSRKQAVPQKFVEGSEAKETVEPEEPELDICNFGDDGIEVGAVEEVAEEVDEAVEYLCNEENHMSKTDEVCSMSIATVVPSVLVPKTTSHPLTPRSGLFDVCSLEQDKNVVTIFRSLTTAAPGVVSTAPPVVASCTLSTGNYQMVVKRAGSSPLMMSVDKPSVRSKEMPMDLDQEQPQRNSTGSRPVTPVTSIGECTADLESFVRSTFPGVKTSGAMNFTPISGQTDFANVGKEIHGLNVSEGSASNLTSVGPKQRILALPVSVISSITKPGMGPITISSKSGLTTVPVTVSVNDARSFKLVPNRPCVVHTSTTMTVTSNSRNFTVPVTKSTSYGSYGRGTRPLPILPKSNLQPVFVQKSDTILKQESISGKFPVPVSVSITPGIGPTEISFPTSMTGVSVSGQSTATSTSKSEMIRMPLSSLPPGTLLHLPDRSSTALTTAGTVQLRPGTVLQLPDPAKSASATSGSSVNIQPGTVLRLPDPAKTAASTSGSSVNIQPGSLVQSNVNRWYDPMGVESTQSTAGMVRVPIVVASTGCSVPKGTPGYLLRPAGSCTPRPSVVVKGSSNAPGKPPVLITGTTASQQHSTAKPPTIISGSSTTRPQMIIHPISALPRPPIIPVEGNASMPATKIRVQNVAAKQTTPSNTSATSTVKSVSQSSATTNRIPSPAEQPVWKKMSTVNPETGKIMEIPYAKLLSTTVPSASQHNYAKMWTSEGDQISPRIRTLSPICFHDYAKTPDKNSQPMPVLTQRGTDAVLEACTKLAAYENDLSTASELIMELPKSFTANVFSPIKSNQNAATLSLDSELCNEMLVNDEEAAGKNVLDSSSKSEEENEMLSKVLEVQREQDTTVLSEAEMLSTCSGLPATGSVNTLTTVTCLSSAKTHVSPSKKSSAVKYEYSNSQDANSDEDVLTIDMEVQLNTSSDALRPCDLPLTRRLFEAGASELPEELFCRDTTSSPLNEDLLIGSCQEVADILTGGTAAVQSLSSTPIPVDATDTKKTFPSLEIEVQKPSTKSQPKVSKDGQNEDLQTTNDSVSRDPVPTDMLIEDTPAASTTPITAATMAPQKIVVSNIEVTKPKKKRKPRAKKAAASCPTGEGPEGDVQAGEVTNAEGTVFEKPKRKRKSRAKKTNEEKTTDEIGENDRLSGTKIIRKRKPKKPKLEAGVVVLAETSQASVMQVEVATQKSVTSEGGKQINMVSVVKVSASENATGKVTSAGVMSTSAAVLSSSQTVQTKLPPGKYPIGISELNKKVIYVQTSQGKIPFKIPGNAFIVPAKDSPHGKSSMTVTEDLPKCQSVPGGETCVKFVMTPSGAPVSMLSSTGSILSGTIVTSASTKPGFSTAASTTLTSSLPAGAITTASVQTSSSLKPAPPSHSAAMTKSSAPESSEEVSALRTLVIATPSSSVTSVKSDSTTVTASSKAALVESKAVPSKPSEITSDIHVEPSSSDDATLKMNSSETLDGSVSCELRPISVAPESTAPKKDVSFPISISTPTAGETIAALPLPSTRPEKGTMRPNTPNMPGQITPRLPNPNVNKTIMSSGPRIRGPNIVPSLRIRGPAALLSGFTTKNSSPRLRASTLAPSTGSHSGTSGPTANQKDPIIISFAPRHSGPAVDKTSPEKGENLGLKKRRRCPGMPDPIIDEIMKPQHAKRERKPTKRFLEADTDSESEKRDKTPEKRKSKSNKLSPDADKVLQPESAEKLKSDTTPQKGSKNVKGSGRKKGKLDAESSAWDFGATGSVSPGMKRKQETVDVAEDISEVADAVPKKKRRRKKVGEGEPADADVGKMDTSTPDVIVEGVADEVQKKKKKRRKKTDEGKPLNIVGTMDTSVIDETVVKENEVHGGDIVQQNQVPVVPQDQVQSSVADDNVLEADDALPTKRKRRPKNFGDGMLSMEDVDLRYKVTKAEKAAEKIAALEKALSKSMDGVEKKEKKVLVKGKKVEKEQSSVKKVIPDLLGVDAVAIPKSKGRKSTVASGKKTTPVGTGKSVGKPKKKCAKKLALVNTPELNSKPIETEGKIAGTIIVDILGNPVKEEDIATKDPGPPKEDEDKNDS